MAVNDLINLGAIEALEQAELLASRPVRQIPSWSDPHELSDNAFLKIYRLTKPMTENLIDTLTLHIPAPTTISGLSVARKALGFSFVKHISLIPLTSVIVFAVGYSFGLGPIPFAYMSELFPQQAKNVGAPVCMAIATVANTAVALTFPYFMEYLGMQWCFWIFALNCLYAAIFTKYQVPETKGRTLEEIQLMLD